MDSFTSRRVTAEYEAMTSVRLPRESRREQTISRKALWRVLGSVFVIGLTVGCFYIDSHVALFVRNHKTVESIGWAAWVARWGDFGGVAAGASVLWVAAYFFRLRGLAYWIQVMAVSAVLSGVSANVIRGISGRTRPNAGLVEGWHGPSAALTLSRDSHRFHAFPSAHTAVVAGFLSPVLVVAMRRRRARWVALGGGAVVGIGVMAVSRVWTGAHHLSDVWAAMVLGVGWGVYFSQARVLGCWMGRLRRTFLGTRDRSSRVTAPSAHS